MFNNRKYGIIDLLRFKNFANENPDMKSIELIKNYNIKYPEVSEAQKLKNLKKFFDGHVDFLNQVKKRNNELE